MFPFTWLIPTLAYDVVGIYDEEFSQVLFNARPVKAAIKQTSRPMEHPLETGAIITDHKIVNPVEIDLSLICDSTDYRSVYSQARDLFRNSALLSVQTRTAIYGNMIITDMPHEETPELYDAIPIMLRLKEVVQVKSTPTYAPRDEKLLDTKQRGEQQGKKIDSGSFADEVQAGIADQLGGMP